MNRRRLLQGAGWVPLAGMLSVACTTPRQRFFEQPNYALIEDPNGVLDLPPGFSYEVLSRLGDTMTDGYAVLDAADGMGCFALGPERVALVRNHELTPDELADGGRTDTANVFDVGPQGPLPGGTSTLIYNLATRQVEREHLSLQGTIRNCAGGTTPWGTWLSCEEDVSSGAAFGRAHGWVFEVDPRISSLAPPRPLYGLGRFLHEAAAVDPRTGIVYLTEDRRDGLFYRFLPTRRGDLSAPGRLQAMVLRDDRQDLRNWHSDPVPMRQRISVDWIDLQDVDAPDDDLRLRGTALGAAPFARGEGIVRDHSGIYFCCTNGGAIREGQIFRYHPSLYEGEVGERDQPGTIEIFFESADVEKFTSPDNLCVSPRGDVIVCEDMYADTVRNHLRLVTQAGELHDLAFLRLQTELAGACFSPDGQTLFVNVYSPTMTLAVRGPF